MRLHYSPICVSCRKVRAVAAELGLDLELVRLDLLDRDQTRPEYVALNPNAQVPTLVDGEVILWQSNAILQYLAESQDAQKRELLWPQERAARADVARWMFWEAADFGPAVNTVVYETLFRRRAGLGDPSLAEIDKGLTWFHRFTAVLEGLLKEREYVCGGNNPSLADFSIAAPLSYAEAAELPLRSYGAVRAWRERLEQRPSLSDCRLDQLD